MSGGRPSGPKTRCGGLWTEAKFKSFIKNNLRRASIKWAPIQNIPKKARTGRGLYRCAGCNEEVPATIKVDRKRVKFIFVDHINPIVDPNVGWTNWDDVIDKMFCEEDNLQLLCGDCHSTKTAEEKLIAKSRRSRENNNNE